MSEINQLKKLLQNHEKRISKLESSDSPSKKSLKSKPKKITISYLVNELKIRGFFDKPRFRDDLVKKLEEMGHIYPANSLDYALLNSVKSGILGRKKINGKWGYVKR